MIHHRTRRSRTVARAGAVGLATVLAVMGVGVSPAFATPATTAATETTETATTPISVEDGEPRGSRRCGRTPRSAPSPVWSSDGAQVTLTAEHGAMRVTFLDEGTFRLEADPSGEFTDPANTPQDDPARTADIVVGADTLRRCRTCRSNEGPQIRISTRDVSIVDRSRDRSDHDQARRRLGRLGRIRTDHVRRRIVDAAPAPTSTGEQFLGGGMQNGRSVHTDATINIARNFDWDDDGYPNAVPYYMSSNGYGVLRNTFARGSYDFAAHTTTHEERRFDAYYFVGDYKESLESYTQLTGRPMMPPIYALEYGDADCYNRSNPTYSGSRDPSKLRTPQSLDVARGFVEHDMPAGWMLVNDGYGCEYQELPETVDAIEEETGLKTGLWTQRSLTEQEYEVGEAGIRTAQARCRVGGIRLPARADGLRGGARRHRAVLRRARHVAHGGGMGRLAALRHAVDRRPQRRPRRGAVAGLGAHRRRQLGSALHDW